MSANSVSRGLSPVVGVILMVAITVILAASLAAFVLGFGGLTNEPAQAGIVVDGNDVRVLDTGNTDALYIMDEDNSSYALNGVGSSATLPTGEYSVVGVVDGHETIVQTVSVTDEDLMATGEYGVAFDNSQNQHLQITDERYYLDPREESFTISTYADYQEGTRGALFLKGHTSRSYGVDWRGDSISFGVRDSNMDGERQIVPVDWDRYNSVLVTVAFDSETDTATLYLNGTESGTIDYSDAGGELDVDSSAWNVGGHSRMYGTSSESDVVWTADDVRFYDRALEQGDVESLSNGEVVTEGLIGHWPLNEGEGTTTQNRSTSEDSPLQHGPEWTTPLAPLTQPRTAP